VQSPERITIGRFTYRMFVLLVISSVALQKVALPGTDQGLPLSLLVLVLVTVGLALKELLVVNMMALRAYLLLIMVTGIATLYSVSSGASMASWYLVCTVQACLVFRLAPESIEPRQVFTLMSLSGVLFAAAGLVQMVVQAFFGEAVAFWLDFNLPEGLAIKGFHNLNPLGPDSPWLKSNGVFFAEPSHFCQFLALALLCELFTRTRVSRLIIICAGMVSSYSGTGILTSLLFAPFFIRQRFATVALAAALVAAGLIIAQDVLNVAAITNRVSELSTPGSSGYARFVSMFGVLKRVTFADGMTFLLGRGPGTVTEFFPQQAFDTFAPTWAKIVYEYGTGGTAAYAFFFVSAVRPGTAMTLPVVFTYFVLGNYLVDAGVMSLLLVLAVWPGPNKQNQEQTDCR
jgi:hypothetical protein